MGIRHLQTFMQKCVINGFVDYAIIDECEKYYNEKNCVPIIVIDLMGLVKLSMQEKHDETLCGGRHNLYQEFLENIFQKLKSCADLVFFQDGPVAKEKYTTWYKRQEDKYNRSIDIMDKVNSQWPLDDIIKSMEYQDLPSITTNMMMIQVMAKKYGEYIISVTRECDAEIARYAYLTPNVIAVLADDTDFLIFPKMYDWKYISLNKLDPETLQTKEYSKSALRDYLNLDDVGLIILSTLGGNDIVRFEEVEGFHKSLVGSENFYKKRFSALARFIYNLPVDRIKVIKVIARQVFGNTKKYTLKKIEESLGQYNLEFEIKVPDDPLLKYCNDNCFDFSASILNRSIKNFTLLFYDLRVVDFPNLHQVVTKMISKQIGIILMSEKDLQDYEVVAKMSHQDVYRLNRVPIVRPNQEVPPFAELLQRDSYPQHDDIRFQLLKWTIGESFGDVDLESIPKNYFVDILVLTFMVAEQFIAPIEADIILLTIKHVETKTVPPELKVPQLLNGRAFRISFLFTKFHMMIKRSMEVTGLKHLTKLLNFDGVLFHNLYLKQLAIPINTKFLLGELNQYCCYKLK